ncbi:acyl carrier protein [Aquimarina hainanensis]|uniref:Acyl carrier protein n=1 Tax=Aquimarina hainanensis TaxID=1578017 RepID=A0ABW5N888_9FLAO|nr:acyl carrier protein [Aquimarina sp. TRL1]QKX03644.1 acyl carrier protein [Aquimarina sp. TRL1]
MDKVNERPVTADGILLQLKQMIIEVVGEDFLSLEDINEDCSFTDDLEMESIEIVQFADKVKGMYGEHVDLAGWMSSMEMEKIFNLTLKEVVAYLEKAILATN